ncbi:MAG: PHP domain-containing protein [Chloroflexota bacterium]
MKLHADLHVHTTASDGRFSPSEIVRLAAERDLSVLAITDHDSLEGIAGALEAARAYPDLLVVPGVEINTDVPGAEVHVLGYCVDHRDQGLGETLRRLRQQRLERGKKMVARLAELGVHVDWRRVREFAGDGAVGRPHVAQAILEAGYAASLGEAFERYIGRNGPAYVEREKVTSVEAVHMVRRAGGFAALAHPHSLGPERLEEFLGPLLAAGLTAIEAYYDGYDGAEVDWLVSLAGRRGLLLCGGSDYHGFGGNETPLGGVEVPQECVEKFLDLASKHSPDLFVSWTLMSSR